MPAARRWAHLGFFCGVAFRSVPLKSLFLAGRQGAEEGVGTSGGAHRAVFSLSAGGPGDRSHDLVPCFWGHGTHRTSSLVPQGPGGRNGRTEGARGALD